MNCPKCKDTVLRKNGYDSPFRCKSCGGLWLELEKFPHFFETVDIKETMDHSPSSHDEKAGFCPLGHGLLTRAKVDEIDDHFYLEKCHLCGGIWFDNDEWQRIIENNLVHNLNDLWCKSWQAQQRKRKTRKKYLELNKKVFGVTIFEKILELSDLLKNHPDTGMAMALLQQEIHHLQKAEKKRSK